MKKALLIILSLLLICGGAFIGVRYLLDLNAAKDIYTETEEKFILPVQTPMQSEAQPEAQSEAQPEEDADADDGHDFGNMFEVVKSWAGSGSSPEKSNDYIISGPWQDMINVDLKSLTIQYPDVKGWIFFENEKISYPVVQGYSDEKYIRMSYNGEKISAGSIFMEAFNADDFSDAHTIIYGHNMKNRSMFGNLRNYLEQPKYYDGHQYFQIIKLNSDGNIEKNRYRVFAYCKTQAQSEIYTVCREHDVKFAEVVNKIIEYSANKTGIPVSAENYVVTLSTCSNGDNMLTVSGVLVDVDTQ